MFCSPGCLSKSNQKIRTEGRKLAVRAIADGIKCKELESCKVVRVTEQRGAGADAALPRTADYAGTKQSRHLSRFGLIDAPTAPPTKAAVVERRRDK